MSTKKGSMFFDFWKVRSVNICDTSVFLWRISVIYHFVTKIVLCSLPSVRFSRYTFGESLLFLWVFSLIFIFVQKKAYSLPKLRLARYTFGVSQVFLWRISVIYHFVYKKRFYVLWFLKGSLGQHLWYQRIPLENLSNLSFCH